MTSSSIGSPPPGHDPAGMTRTGTPSPGTSGCTGTPGKARQSGPGAPASPSWTTTAGGSRPACISVCTSSSRSRPRWTGRSDGSPLNAIVAAAAAGGTVTVTGPSGGGKSHAARHAALALAGRGQLPIWVRCSEYAKGRFSVLLARATAPYTVDQPLDLIRRASDAGAVPVLILDGLNECPAGLARELLEQLAAARLRVPCGVVITSAAEVPLPDAGDIRRVELQLPAASRTAGAAVLLRRCRLSRLGRVPDAPRTRPGRRVRRRARPGPDSRRPVRRVRAAAGGQPGPRRAPPAGGGDGREGAQLTHGAGGHSAPGARRDPAGRARRGHRAGLPAADRPPGQGELQPRAVRPVPHR